MLKQKMNGCHVLSLSQHICLILFVFIAETFFLQAQAAPTAHNPSEVLLVYNSNSPVSTVGGTPAYRPGNTAKFRENTTAISTNYVIWPKMPSSISSAGG